MAALQDELSSIEFAIQELATGLKEVTSDAQEWEEVRHRLVGRRREIEAELVSLYSSLPRPEAIGHLTDFLNSHPANVQARLERGRVYREAGEHRWAVEDYALAAALDPARAEPHLRLAQLYDLLGRKAEALYQYGWYLGVESDPSRRLDVEGVARSLEKELVPEQGEHAEQTIEETPQRLEYLLSTLKELPLLSGLERRGLRQIVQRYAQRLEALTAPPAPEPTAQPVALTDETATARPVGLAAPAAPPARVVPAQPSKPPVAPPVFREPPRPLVAPPVPREPFDWGSFWAALFSERVLTAVLGFGVLLVGISSLALVVEQWREGGRVGKSYDDVWAGIQVLLVAQLLMFLFAGYIVKERLKLRLSGLGIISLGALWVPFNTGALMYMVYDAPGYVVLPGLGLRLDLPMQAWLIVAGTCVPTWGALTYRFRGHLLTHGTVAAVGATVALFVAVLGSPWEWSVAALAVLTVPLLFAWQHLRKTSFRDIAEPLFWTAQATLWGVVVVLLMAYMLGEASGYSVALVTLAGACLYAAARRFSPKLAYEYVVAALLIVTVFFALSELDVVPSAFYDALLMVMAVVYIVVGRMREKTYQEVELLRSSQWPALQPLYSVGYLMVLAAVVWPSFGQVSHMGVLYGATAVTLISARWWDRPFWTYLGSLLLVVAFLLTLNQVESLPADYWSVALGVLAWVYLAGGVTLRRAPAHAVPLFLGAVALSVASLTWASTAADVAVLTLALPVAIGAYAVFAVLIQQGRDVALVRIFGYAMRSYAGGVPDEQTVRRWGSILFMALGASLAPVWTVLARVWLDIPGLWAGLDFIGLVLLYAFIGYRLVRCGLNVHARVILALGALLAIAAPMYHAATYGSSWVLAGILYADVALAALAGTLLRQQRLLYLAAGLLMVPFAITLDLVGVSVAQWAVPWAALGMAYFLGALALRRLPIAATPMFSMTYVLTGVALAWAAFDSSGTMARWTFPMVGAVYGASAVLVHRRGAPGLHSLVERVVGGLGKGLPADRIPPVGAAVFGLAVAVLVPLWMALVLLRLGVDGAVHAYNPLAWAFVSALLAHFVLRRYAALYATVFLAFGVVLGVSAAVVGLLGTDQIALTAVLYGATVLTVLYRFFLRSEAPSYLAAVLLLVSFGLTLDLADVPTLLWSTPLMALAVTYLALGRLLESRLHSSASHPLYHVGFSASGLALAWAGAWVLTNWVDPIPDTAPVWERLLASAGLFLGAAAYAVAGYRRGDAKFGHLAAWVVTGAFGIVLDALPLTTSGMAVIVALGAVAYVLAGVALRRLRQANSAAADGQPTALCPRVRLGNSFSWPMVVAGYGVAVVSLGMATFDLLDTQEVTWPINLTYMIGVGLLGASAYLFRSPGFVTGATTLFILPFTLFVYDLFGETAELLSLPSAALAFGWTGLAIGYLSLGMAVERRAPRYSQALPVLGYLLLLAAVAASLGSAGRQSVVFGVIVVVAVASAFITHRLLTSNLVDLVSRLYAIPLEVARRYVTLAFVAVAGLLSPLWGLEVLALFTTEAPVQGILLAVAAPAYVLVGVLMTRRTDRLYAGPVYVAGYGMTAVAPVLTWASQPLSVIALATGAATYAISAYAFRRSAWSPLLLYPSVGLAVASYILALDLLPLDPRFNGLALLPGAVASLGIGWWLYRRAGRSGAPASARLVVKYIGAASATAWTMPFLVVGHGLSLAAVALSVPYEPQRLIALLATTGVFGVSLGVFRSWGWLYPLLLSAHLAFASAVTLQTFDLPVIGILFVPPTIAMGLFMRITTRGVKVGDLRALMTPWAIPFIIFGILDMGTSVVLAAGADWAGLMVTASYAVLAAVAAHSTQNRVLPYVSTAFVTASVIFASRLVELTWSQSAVVWASQGLLMWWGGQVFGALSRRGRPEAITQTRLAIWEAPLRNTGLRLSWFALAFIVVWFFLGLFAPERFGTAQVQDASAVMAILGLLYIGMAFVARRVWFGYLAVGLLLGSWTLQLIDREIPFVQAYAIPAGLYLLGIAFFERRRSPGSLPAVIEGSAVLLLLVSSFWQSVADDPAWVYAILLAAEAVLLVLWGAANNTRLSFIGGVLAFIVDVLWQTGGLLSTRPGAWIGLIVGSLIVITIAGIEWRREQLIALGREWIARMRQWSW